MATESLRTHEPSPHDARSGGDGTLGPCFGVDRPLTWHAGRTRGWVLGFDRTPEEGELDPKRGPVGDLTRALREPWEPVGS